jgi:peptidoglycan/xylan/chitin deacetylase (PgdA/CDA1 family)
MPVRTKLIRTCAAILCALSLTLLAAGCGGSSSSSSTAAPNANAAAAKTVTGSRAAAQTAPAVRQVQKLIPPPGAPLRTVRVPVLTYHRVVPASAVGQLDLKVDPANFLAELQAIRAAGFHSITQAQLFNALYHGASLPSKPVILSFDDGYVDDIRTILPDLLRMHMVGTFFVITGRMSEPGFLNAQQIRQLDQAGMDVGDHTANHVDLNLLTPSELRTETLGSRRALQRVLQHFVYSFAYPFGDHGPTVDAAVRAAGFTMAYTTAGGVTESTGAPFDMPRVHVGRSETPGGLVSLLQADSA